MNLLNQFDRQKIIWIIYKNIIYLIVLILIQRYNELPANSGLSKKSQFKL